MSASARASFAPAAAARAGLPPLAIILGAGLLLRLLFLGSTGFHNDVAAFESWTLTLRDNPPWLFYAKSGFADYPPGYFVVLWVLAKIYAVVPGLGGEASSGWPVLRVLVKLPAIAMDLVNAYVVYRIVRRYAANKVALVRERAARAQSRGDLRVVVLGPGRLRVVGPRPHRAVARAASGR